MSDPTNPNMFPSLRTQALRADQDPFVLRTVSGELAESEARRGGRTRAGVGLTLGAASKFQTITQWTYIDADNPSTNYAQASPIYAQSLNFNDPPSGTGTKIVILKFPAPVQNPATIGNADKLILLLRCNLFARLTGTFDSLGISGTPGALVNCRIRSRPITDWGGQTIETLTYANRGDLTLNGTNLYTAGCDGWHTVSNYVGGSTVKPRAEGGMLAGNSTFAIQIGGASAATIRGVWLELFLATQGMLSAAVEAGELEVFPLEVNGGPIVLLRTW